MREVNAASFKGALGVLSTTAAVGLDFDNLDVSPHRRQDMTLKTESGSSPILSASPKSTPFARL